MSSTTRESVSRRLLTNHLEKLMTGAFLTFALGLMAANLPAARSSEVPVSLNQAHAYDIALVPSSSSQTSLPDGVYLYGQAAEANQIGSAYMVFRVSDRQVAGAFYMPFSSFDCFQGEFQDERLALTVVDSYDQTSHPYSIALQTETTVATTNNPAIAPVGLSGYHPIEPVSDTDYTLLATCQASG